MRGLVVYESMFGCTRSIAEAITQGLGSRMDVRLIRAAVVQPEDLAELDFLGVGAPTHVHGLPRAATRRGTPDYLEKPGNDLVLEPGADSDPGVREWLDNLGSLDLSGAAFDTRFHGSPLITGRASKGISRTLVGRGAVMVLPVESFLVDKHGRLEAGEVERARGWGVTLAGAVAERVTTSA